MDKIRKHFVTKTPHSGADPTVSAVSLPKEPWDASVVQDAVFLGTGFITINADGERRRVDPKEVYSDPKCPS